MKIKPQKNKKNIRNLTLKIKQRNLSRNVLLRKNKVNSTFKLIRL